uniref:Cytosolic Fe-S cluster assembly factor NUBP1 homolog n=1 Tax=Ditylum brightwellii TaxID=49249 RepID=A0A6S9A5B6_9STRA|mmetsp:Transcript_30414/g.44728  ORF Transcript_30414/g.44728 Transcript_30414/m.44728 type:complete len:386 (-) Transcript_30414:1285-2442(-)
MTETPSNANDGCVGPTSETAGKSSACEGCPNQSACSSGAFRSPEALAAADAEADSLRSSLSNISHTLLVLSGKGGVGKSTFACQLAHTLASRGYSVGVLDVDICGPSAPRMLGVAGREVHRSGSGWSPVYANPNLAVMSISFLLPDADAAVVWRGPRKNGMIKQFLTETDWNGTDGLDYLIVDTPPGTSDEHISTVQFLSKIEGGVSGAVVVTTPEEVSMADVRKELNFCKKTKVRVVGIVENMAGLQMKVEDLKFLRVPIKEIEMATDDNESMEQDENDNSKKGATVDCTQEVLDILRAKCPEVLNMVASADVFPPSGGGPREMAQRFNAPYLGALPLDPNLLKSCEDGISFVDSYVDSPAIRPLNDIVDRIVQDLPVDVEWED